MRTRKAEVVDEQEGYQPAYNDEQYPEQRRIRPEMFLLMLFCLTLCRLLLYIKVERLGTRAFIEALIADAVFGLAGIGLVGNWAVIEWNVCGWMMVPKCGFLFSGLLILLDGLTGGSLWEGHMRAGGSAIGPFVYFILLVVGVAFGLVEHGINAMIAQLKRWQ